MPEPRSVEKSPLKVKDPIEGEPPDDGRVAEAFREHALSVNPKMACKSPWVRPESSNDLDPSLTLRVAPPRISATQAKQGGRKHWLHFLDVYAEKVTDATCNSHDASNKA